MQLEPLPEAAELIAFNCCDVTTGNSVYVYAKSHASARELSAVYFGCEPSSVHASRMAANNREAS